MEIDGSFVLLYYRCFADNSSAEQRKRCLQEYDCHKLEYQRLSRLMAVIQKRFTAHLALFKEERRRGLKSGPLGESDDVSILKMIWELVFFVLIYKSFPIVFEKLNNIWPFHLRR